MFLANQIAGFFDQQDFQKKWMHLSIFWEGVRLSKKEEIGKRFFEFISDMPKCANGRESFVVEI